MKKISLQLLLLFVVLNSYSQTSSLKDNFNCQIRRTVGDLNKDGVLDEVIIDMDTVSPSRPLRLQIFFTQPNNKQELFFSSTEIIEAMYPVELNGEYNGSQIPAIFIEDGKLQIDFYINGNSRYEFVYNNGEFELIQFSYTSWDGKNILETEFNLLTGKYSKHIEVLNTSEVILDDKKEVHIKPLPLLKGFKPFENELY